MAALRVTKPSGFDTLVPTNLHADILPYLASSLTGSLGNVASANINPADDVPSMFEPIHGSAFDIVGKGIANPIGAIWTGAMMLDHLGEGRAAQRLMAAIAKETANGPRTPAPRGPAASTAVPPAGLAPLARRPCRAQAAH